MEGLRYDVVLMLLLATAYLMVVQSHVCMLVKRPDPHRGGTFRWSLPTGEICLCQGVVAPNTGSICPSRSEFRDGELWFVDELRAITMRSNWTPDILDVLLQRTAYCSDECTLETGNNCDINAVCADIPGSFTCTCNAGYNGDGFSCFDIDECVTGSHNCDSNAGCSNKDGGFTCTCNARYDGDGNTCRDIDECVTDSHNCDTNAGCSNTDGTFTCTCNAGYDGEGFNCIDIDECLSGSHNCDANAGCSNTDGGFTCTCNTRYDGNGTTCSDIDECMTGSHNCDANAGCSNTDGTLTCTCNAGYDGDGVICTDIDECITETDNCDANAACSNTNGAFTCTCNAGYDGDGTTCTDINECNSGYHNCDANAACSNTDGGFNCTCNALYSGDGISCDFACNSSLGVEEGRIADSQFASSSDWSEVLGTSATLYAARLNRVPDEGSIGAWMPDNSLYNEHSVNEWIQVNLGVQKWVSGVMLQGRQDSGDWVTKFTVMYGDDGIIWELIRQTNDQSEIVFDGNVDRNTVVTNYFPEPILAIFIRIYPTEWQSAIALRFELLGCENEA